MVPAMRSAETPSRGPRGAVLRGGRKALALGTPALLVAVLLIGYAGGPAAAARAPRVKKPGAPTGVVALPIEGGATVSWDAPLSDGGSAITGYVVLVASKLHCTTSATTCTITGFKDGKTYSVNVRAVNSVGEGKNSSVVKFTAGQSQNCANFVPDANLRYCDFHNADLAGIDIPGADLTGAKLDGANLSGADLAGVQFGGEAQSNGEDLTGVNFASADLTGADLDKTYLYTTSFNGADLANATFDGARVITVDFSDAVLTGADLSAAELINNDTWSNTTCPDGTNSNSDGGTCVDNLG